MDTILITLIVTLATPCLPFILKTVYERQRPSLRFSIEWGSYNLPAALNVENLTDTDIIITALSIQILFCKWLKIPIKEQTIPARHTKRIKGGNSGIIADQLGRYYEEHLSKKWRLGWLWRIRCQTEFDTKTYCVYH